MGVSYTCLTGGEREREREREREKERGRKGEDDLILIIDKSLLVLHWLI